VYNLEPPFTLILSRAGFPVSSTFTLSSPTYVVHLSLAYTGGTGSLSSLPTDFQEEEEDKKPIIRYVIR